MNIMFLDIDGVLVTERYIEKQIKRGESFKKEARNHFDPDCMWVIREIITKHNCKVVITSTWRTDYPDDNLWKIIINNFKRYDIDKEIIGITNIDEKSRGEQIKDYLNKHKCKKFIIIDDDNDMGDLENHLILCNAKYGINEYKKEIDEILKRRV